MTEDPPLRPEVVSDVLVDLLQCFLRVSIGKDPDISKLTRLEEQVRYNRTRKEQDDAETEAWMRS